MRRGNERESPGRNGLDGADVTCSGDEVVPPTLGLVLVLCAWRYVALPAGTISLAYGMRKLPTKVFLYDPVFVSLARPETTQR